MTNKKKLLQIGLLFLGLIILFFTYFFNFQKEPVVNVTTKEEIIDNEEFLEEGVNRFENVEYQGIDNNGNKFTIGSEFAEFEKERPEIINMENVICYFTFKDNTVLTIYSDKGIYNNISNDMNFSENVNIALSENKIFSK